MLTMPVEPCYKAHVSRKTRVSVALKPPEIVRLVGASRHGCRNTNLTLRWLHSKRSVYSSIRLVDGSRGMLWCAVFAT